MDQKLLQKIRSVLEVAFITSPDPKDRCIEIHKSTARGLIRRIKNTSATPPEKELRLIIKALEIASGELVGDFDGKEQAAMLRLKEKLEKQFQSKIENPKSKILS